MNDQIKLGSVIGYINMIVSAIIAMIYIPLLTNRIGSSEYGVYQLMGSLIAYFTTAYTSLNASVLKSYVESFQQNDIEGQNTLAISRKIFRIISLIILVMSIPVAFAIYIMYSNSLSSHELNESILVFIVLVCNILIYLNNNIYSAVIQAHEHFVYRKSIDLLSQCLQPIAVIVFINKYPYALTIVFIQVVINALVSLSNYYYSKYKLNIVVKYHHKNTFLVKSISTMSIAVLGVSFADQIFWRVDQLILGKLYGTKIVTVYSIPTQINAMYINIGTVIGGMILPSVVSVIHSNNKLLLNKKFMDFGRLQSYILSFVLFGIILFADELMSILYKDYNKNMFIVLILLAVPYTIDLIQNAGNAILQAKNLYGSRAKILLSASLVNIGVTVFLSIGYGMVGAASATGLTIILTSGFLMNLIYDKRANLDVVGFWKNVFPIWLKLSLILIIGAFIKKINLNNLIYSFVLHTAMYTVTYIVLLIAFGMSQEDKVLLFKELRNKEIL